MPMFGLARRLLMVERVRFAKLEASYLSCCKMVSRNSVENVYIDTQHGVNLLKKLKLTIKHFTSHFAQATSACDCDNFFILNVPNKTTCNKIQVDVL